MDNLLLDPIDVQNNLESLFENHFSHHGQLQMAILYNFPKRKRTDGYGLMRARF